MTREENIRAILECNFSGTKEELIDIAVKSIMALSQEPTVTSTDEPMTMVYPTIVCEDTISREAVKDILNNSYSLTDAEHRVEQLPSVTQKSGKWIEHKHNGMSYIECSKCSCWFLRMHLTRNSYCPNCGAKMESEVSE